MMHALEWKAHSNDSVVDVTPGVELWHTLWFMWESPRCPEHQIFTILSDNCALLDHFGDGTTSWSLLEIYFTFAELDDELQITCQRSAQAKTHLMYLTKCIFWNHVKWAHKLVLRAQRHTPPIFPTFRRTSRQPFWNFCLSGESLCMGFVKHMWNALSSSKRGSSQLEQSRQFSGIMREEFYPASPL